MNHGAYHCDLTCVSYNEQIENVPLSSLSNIVCRRNEMANRKSAVQQKGGVLQEFLKQAKLVGRLIGDRRVNGFLKLIPIASLVYLISPIDLIPGMAVPLVGALDDAAVVWIGTALFIELCPSDVVQEHRDALNGYASGDSGEIIDAESRDINN
jgi:uncharacterized membrane protein YkvA (DUF1232 family)